MAGIIPLLIAGEGSHYYSMLRINDIKGAMAQRHNGSVLFTCLSSPVTFNI
jgi:hypothetical protein